MATKKPDQTRDLRIPDTFENVLKAVVRTRPVTEKKPDK